MNNEWIVFSCYTYDQRPLLRLLLLRLVLSDQTTTYQIAFYRLNSVSLISTIVYTIFFAHHEQQQTNFLCLSRSLRVWMQLIWGWKTVRRHGERHKLTPKIYINGQTQKLSQHKVCWCCHDDDIVGSWNPLAAATAVLWPFSNSFTLNNIYFVAFVSVSLFSLLLLFRCGSRIVKKRIVLSGDYNASRMLNVCSAPSYIRAVRCLTICERPVCWSDCRWWNKLSVRVLFCFRFFSLSTSGSARALKLTQHSTAHTSWGLQDDDGERDSSRY